jgi:hypothetical protein
LNCSKVFFHRPGSSRRRPSLDHELKFALAELNAITVLERGRQNLSAIDENVIGAREISDSDSVPIDLEGGMLGGNRSIVDSDLRRFSAPHDGPKPIEFEFRSRRWATKDRHARSMILEKGVRPFGLY